MVDFQFSASLSDQIWEQVGKRSASLTPEELVGARSGACSAKSSSRRQYRRVAMPGRAAVRRGEELLGVYTVDVSPASIGFCCPVQLFPKEVVTLFADELEEMDISIARCRRVKDGCYACGARFVAGAMGPAAYSELLRQLSS